MMRIVSKPVSSSLKSLWRALFIFGLSAALAVRANGEFIPVEFESDLIFSDGCE